MERDEIHACPIGTHRDDVHRGVIQSHLWIDRQHAHVAKRSVTYGDLVEQFIALSSVERFERIPHPRYINFLAEYHAAEKGASREDALAAWRKLKKMDVPKTYASWRAVSRRARGR